MKNLFRYTALWLNRFATVVLLITFHYSALAQNEAGQIAGKVSDPNGAAIPGATVKTNSVDTGIIRETTTDNAGFYIIGSLQPGLYDVQIQAAGFANRTQRVRVSVGTARRLETLLSVTPVTENQEIIEGSGGVDVNTQSHRLSDPISGRQIRELPTITRDPYDLVTLSGNVTPTTNPNGIGGQRDIAYSINGQRPSGNNVQLDGGENITNYTTALGQRIPLDAVQEIQVLTSGYLPEYGRTGGGLINLATRQGSNDFTGSVYWFHRNRALSSNSFENNALGVPKGQLVANQFGYAIGGRLVPDRLFFFNSTEGNIVRNRENRVALTPTSQLIAASAAPTRTFFNTFPLNTTTTSGRTFTVGEIRNLLGITTTAGNAFAALPATLPAFGLAQFSANTDTGAGVTQDTFSTVGRIDYTFTPRSLIYARYAFLDRDFFGGSLSASPFTGFDAGVRERDHLALLNWTQELTRNWFSNSKVSFNRISLTNGALPATPRLFLTGTTRASIGGFATAFPGALPFDAGQIGLLSGPLNKFQAAQDFSTTWGRQQLRIGVSYFYTQDNRQNSLFNSGVAVLGATPAQALNNLVLGQVSTFQTAIDPRGLQSGQTITLPVARPSFATGNSAHDYAGYFTHSLRATSRINVNWGLRYDYFGVPRSRNGRVFSNFFLGTGNTPFAQVRSGQLRTPGTAEDGRLFKRDFDNIAPRIGLAIDLTGDGKTSLRGGYGVTYEQLRNNPLMDVFLNSPNFAVASLTANTGTTGTVALPTNNLGTLGGTTGTTTLPGYSVRSINFGIEAPRVHFWNVALERELTKNMIAAVHYTGSQGTDLPTVSNVNRPGSARALLGDTTASPTARLNDQFGPIFLLTNNGRSNYNALIAELTNSTWRQIGLQFTARYRFAKTLDNVGSLYGFGGLSNFGVNQLTPFNPNNDYGLSDFDIRHRFIGSFNWEVPFDKIGDRLFGGAGTAVARQVFGGWQVTGIFNVQSGTPFTVFNCAGITNAETPCARVALTGTVDQGGTNDATAIAGFPNRFSYIDLSNLTAGNAANPSTGFAPFAAGTTSRNFFRGPRFWNIDMGVSKRFRLSEEVGLQFRGEFFNLFNRANNTILTSETDISSTGFVPVFRSGRRHVQLAVKLTF
jgi:hypothetical protein